ncbi:MAG TPA: rhodanese-like domain-containing protein [Oceanospirillales bacterium]|jgi:rhodanese-related sulfurtransferase|nr:sulfurtransferase [Oleispira sp.]HCM05165.1 rhodanese-like domain-containing protein [Oceanospirillales bacterium]|tara:strand:+ start:5019 stop:5432 length:414 start_codon:yes stop_codon:yes gene_type:complete
MEQALEFISNNWMLVSVWGVFLAAFLWDNNQRSGASISAAQATQMINKQDAAVLDIRDKKEFETGHLANAINIPYASLAERMSELESSKEHPIVLVCKSGQSVGMAGKTLKQKGFQVFRLSGGMLEWTNQNLPVVTK